MTASRSIVERLGTIGRRTASSYRRSILIVLWVVLSSYPVLGEVLNPGTAAYPALVVGVGARGTALGDSYVAMVDDATALFWNPGALGRLQRPMVQTDYRHFPLGGQEEVFSGVMPFQNLGVLGCDLTYRDFGSQDGYDVRGLSTRAFHPSALSVGIGWGVSLHPRVAIGFRTLWFRQVAAEYHETGLVENIGILLGPWDRFLFGVALKNVGLDTDGFSLPLELNVGMTRRLIWGASGLHTVQIAIGLDIRARDQDRVDMGLEYAYRSQFFLRMGWAPRWEDNELNVLQGFTMGVGFSKDRWALDYSLASQGELGWENRVSVSWKPPWTKPAGPKTRPMVEEPRPRATVVSTLSPSKGTTANFLPSAPFAIPGNSLPRPEKGVTLETPATPGKMGDPVVLKFQLTEEDEPNGTALQFFQRAEEALRDGKTDEALAYYQKCVARDPAFEKALIRISQIQYQKAMEAAQKALKVNPNNESLRGWLNRH